MRESLGKVGHASEHQRRHQPEKKAPRRPSHGLPDRAG
jgi:hypothetical protein